MSEEWNEPPPRALEWLLACVASAKESQARQERRTYAVDAEKFGASQAEQWQRDERMKQRALSLVTTLALRLPWSQHQDLTNWLLDCGPEPKPEKCPECGSPWHPNSDDPCPGCGL